MTLRAALNLSAALTLLALTAFAVPARAIDVVIEGDVIRALDDDGNELWTWDHPGAEPAEGQARRRGEGWEGPARIGDRVAWAISDRFFVADAESGRIEHRVLLPHNPRDIRVVDGGFVLEPSRRGWSGGPRHDFHVAPDGVHDVPWLNPVAARYILRDDAERTVLRAAAAALGRTPPVSWDTVFLDPTWRPALESVEPIVLDRARRDATSPWWWYAAARIALALDRVDEARARLEQAASIDDPFADELVQMAFEVDTLAIPDARELSRVMLRRGASAMYAAGFEPSSACAQHMERRSRDPHAQPPSAAPPGDRIADALLRGEAMWWLYPTCNEAGRVFLGLSQLLDAVDRRDEAAIWRERAERSQREAERIGPTVDRPEPDRTRAGLARAAALAMLLSLTVLALELLTARGRRPSDVGLPRGVAPRSELVLVALLALPVLEQTRRLDWDEISHTELPLDIWLGAPGAPSLRAPLRRANTVPAGRMAWAWHLLHAGELDAADDAFATRPDDARAIANRGVIAARRGDDAVATAFFEQALALEPDLVEVSAMLGRGGESLFISHRRELGVSTIAPVPLSPQQSGEGWIAVALTDGIAPEPDPDTGARVRFDTSTRPLATLVPALALLALLGAAMPRYGEAPPSPPSASAWRRALRAAVPGMSPRLRGVRPVVWFVAIALAQAAVAWHASNGETINPFEVYQRPVYPISEAGRVQARLPCTDPASPAWAVAWALAWLVHAAVVVALERRAQR